MKASSTLTLLLAFTIGAILSPVSAETVAEDFEDDTNFQRPTEDWYNLDVVGSGGFFTSTLRALGVQSYRSDPSSASWSSDFMIPGYRGCGSPSSVRFAFNLDVLAGNTVFILSNSTNGGGESPSFEMSIASTGVVSSNIRGWDTSGDAASVSEPIGYTVVADTWYNVTLAPGTGVVSGRAACGNPILVTEPDASFWTLIFEDQPVVFTHDSDTDTTEIYWCDNDAIPDTCEDPDAPSPDIDNFRVEGDSASSLVYVDNLVVSGAFQTNIAAADTATVTDLVGFDVDPTGNLVVVRYNNGEDVATHDSLTLAQAATVDTNCGTRSNGVMAQSDGTDTFAFYIQCDPGDNDPIGMRIRTGSLNTPTSSQLNGCGTSCADFTLTDFSSSGGDGLNELGEIDAFPITYREQSATTFTSSFYLSWGWSSLDNTGTVGVNAFSNHQSDLGPADDRRSYDIGFSNGNANQVCTGVDGEQTYLAAVRSGALSRVYPISFNFETEGGSVLADLVPQSGGTPTTYSSVQGGGEGVACGDGLVAILNGGGIWVMNRDGGLYRSYPDVAVDPRGVALSQETVNSQYLAYVDGASWVVRDLADNATLCSGTMPSGSLIGFYLTGGAQNLYVGTDAASNNLARFELGDVCTPVVDEETGDDIPPEAPTPTGGLFGGAGAAIAPGLGTSTFGGNLFLGIIVVAGCAAGTFALAKGRIAGLILGVGIGVVLAWGLGFFTGGTVFVLVMMCGGGLWLFGRG